MILKERKKQDIYRILVGCLLVILLTGIGKWMERERLSEHSDVQGADAPKADIQKQYLTDVNEPKKEVQEEVQEEAQETAAREPALSPLEIQEMEAGMVLSDLLVTPESLDDFFYSTKITEAVQQRIWNVSYRENSNIQLSELRYLRTLYRGFDGQTHIGELIVNQEIAKDILEIMTELYVNNYPIEKMILVDEYGGEDDASMEDNNTSAFNYRTIAGTDRISNHAMGRAIDINPKYNPYVKEKSNGEVMISPENGAEYADRSREFPYKIWKEDLCCRLFLEHGFTWGGEWNSVKDYQHFEK